MTSMRILHAKHHDEWMAVLGQCKDHDFYHLPAFHALSEENGEGSSRLFVYTEGPYLIALPLLLRPLDTIPAMGETGKEWMDATSVYGYPGPIASHAVLPEDVINRFQAQLEDHLRDLRIVTVFSRLHPLFPQHPVLAGMGECQDTQPTVSINLAAPEPLQLAQYRDNHRDGIRKLTRQGVSCLHDPELRHLEEFITIYHETMQRVDALSNYFFSPDYFRRLMSLMHPNVHHFAGFQADRMICGALILECNGIIQYHLSGTVEDRLKIAPMKLVIDGVRHWACQRGARLLHLGGGRTSDPQDSLLHFKKGFSDDLHTFRTWRWVLFPEVYARIQQASAVWNSHHGLTPVSANYFPAYRCPTVTQDVLVS